ncbi:MAG TPA: epoxide hydrolase [Holophagaceae bacterium]|jgi:pimeloyl-ACP methyl ester carboxylesterase|nr:epoxide hydrolase [Holophagaceae bacterium]
MVNSIEPFQVAVPEHTLADLKTRIRNTRWPDHAPDAPWSQGADIGWLQDLMRYWAEEFDWRAQEQQLAGLPQFRIEIDGVRIHFVHARARGGRGIPLILTHGWPSAFVEYLPLVPLLTDPGRHGIDGPAFDLVIPSLPGYGFSDRPRRTGVNYRYVSSLWHRLMTALEYEHFGAGGGDFGAGVATLMALDKPDALIGLHLTNLELAPYLGSGSRPLSPAEEAYIATADQWLQSEGGYKAIQSTKPQTLGYALNDSPAGLAAWIGEKWRSWSDSHGDLEGHIPRDFLLTLLTLYWVTGSITSSMRDYFDNRWHGITLGPDDVVRVPTGIANFSSQHAFEGDPPREWAERLYNIQRWTPMTRGGHFAPREDPVALAKDIAAFFASLAPGKRR